MAQIHPTEPVYYNEIGSLGEFQEALGLRAAALANFKNELARFKKSYWTTGGTPGEKLLNWTRSGVREDLGTMAKELLRCGAERFWAADRGWIREGDPIYPRDDVT